MIPKNKNFDGIRSTLAIDLLYRKNIFFLKLQTFCEVKKKIFRTLPKKNLKDPILAKFFSAAGEFLKSPPERVSHQN